MLLGTLLAVAVVVETAAVVHTEDLSRLSVELVEPTTD